MYKPIDLLKYEVYVQTDRPLNIRGLCTNPQTSSNMRSMYKTIDLLKYEVYVEIHRPLKI